jgi:hypothetical protein
MKTALSMLAGVSMLALAGAAQAAEPVTLNDAQMDGVTAGYTAIINFVFASQGTAIADLISQTQQLALGSPTILVAGEAAVGPLASVFGNILAVGSNNGTVGLPATAQIGGFGLATTN